MKYTGTVMPATRNAATPQAVAWRLPCLFACANTPVEIAAARATAISTEMGSAAVTSARYGSPQQEGDVADAEFAPSLRYATSPVMVGTPLW